MSRLTVIALLSCLAISAYAKPASEPVVAITSDAPVAEQLANVERALRTEAYSEMSVEDKSRVQGALNRIRVKMGSNERVEQLSPLLRTDVFNDQELINTMMTNAREDSRMICRSERPTGSNRPQRVCMTVAQRREAAEDARKMMRDFTPSQSNQR